MIGGCERSAALAPIRVSGSYWIELSPVLVAANSFYPVQMPVGEGGIVRITAGEADLATNAETQLLRESVVNPDLRIIMTVTEGFYRLVARRSAGIETLADLKGKRVMLPANTSANYYVVAMLRTVGLTEDDVELVPLPPERNGETGMDQMSTPWSAAMWMPFPSGSPSLPMPSRSWAMTRSCSKTAAFTARSSIFTREQRTWKTPTSAARSLSSYARSRRQPMR